MDSSQRQATVRVEAKQVTKIPTVDFEKHIKQAAKNKKAVACPKCGCRVWVNTATGLELECVKCGYRIPDLTDEKRQLLKKVGAEKPQD